MKRCLALALGIAVAVAAFAGCGSKEAKSTAPLSGHPSGPSTGPATTPSTGPSPGPAQIPSTVPPLVYPRSGTFEVTYEDAHVYLVMPDPSKDAEEIRQTMSQSPPYLVGAVTVKNTSQQRVDITVFDPELVYADGRVRGSQASLPNPLHIPPGGQATARYIFARDSTAGLKQILMVRHIEFDEESTPMTPVPE